MDGGRLAGFHLFYCRLVDGVVRGGGVDGGRLAGFLSTAEDRLRIPWRGGAKRL